MLILLGAFPLWFAAGCSKSESPAPYVGGGQPGTEGGLPICTPHVSAACFGGNVMWVDSCGNPESIYAECGDNEYCEGMLCVAYSWSVEFGGDYDDWAYGIELPEDGGYTIAGYTRTEASGWDDAFVIKLNVNGVEEWRKTYGGSMYDRAQDITLTSDGGYVLAGGTWSYGAGGSDGYVIKIDAAGNEEWSKYYGGSAEDWFSEIEQTPDGGYIMIGYSRSYATQWHNYDSWVVRIDAAGNEIWNKSLGLDFYWDWGYSVEPAEDGGFVFLNYGEGYDIGGVDAWLFKLDANGDLVWEQLYGGIFDDWMRGHKKLDDGYILGGYSWDEYMGDSDAWMLKTDLEGEMLWQARFGSEADEQIYDIDVAPDGGFVMAGYVEDQGAMNTDVYVVKTDSNGTLEWESRVGGAGNDKAYAVRATAEGYIVAGYTSEYDSDSTDLLVLKLDLNGNCKHHFDD